jgi:hypothetical protein
MRSRTSSNRASAGLATTRRRAAIEDAWPPVWWSLCPRKRRTAAGEVTCSTGIVMGDEDAKAAPLKSVARAIEQALSKEVDL